MTGALLTNAIVVGSIRYGETSRIVRLATADLGVVGAIAKGVARPRSRFGMALQPLSEGIAHLLPGRGELATLVAFDATDLHVGVTRSLQSFQAASALAELVGRFVPADPQEGLLETLRTGLQMLEAAPADALEEVGLTALWRMVTALGVAPALDACARDGSEVGPGAVAFSVDDGGILCARCAAGHPPIRLDQEDRAALEFFVQGVGDPPALDSRHAAAHRRLLARWVSRHLGEVEMPALTLWQRGPRGS